MLLSPNRWRDIISRLKLIPLTRSMFTRKGLRHETSPLWLRAHAAIPRAAGTAGDDAAGDVRGGRALRRCLDGSATRRSGIDGSVRACNLSDYACADPGPAGGAVRAPGRPRASLDTERPHDPVAGGDRTRRVGVAAAGPGRLHDRRTG